MHKLLLPLEIVCNTEPVFFQRTIVWFSVCPEKKTRRSNEASYWLPTSGTPDIPDAEPVEFRFEQTFSEKQELFSGSIYFEKQNSSQIATREQGCKFGSITFIEKNYGNYPCWALFVNLYRPVQILTDILGFVEIYPIINTVLKLKIVE